MTKLSDTAIKKAADKLRKALDNYNCDQPPLDVFSEHIIYNFLKELNDATEDKEEREV